MRAFASRLLSSLLLRARVQASCSRHTDIKIRFPRPLHKPDRCRAQMRARQSPAKTPTNRTVVHTHNSVSACTLPNQCVRTHACCFVHTCVGRRRRTRACAITTSARSSTRARAYAYAGCLHLVEFCAPFRCNILVVYGGMVHWWWRERMFSAFLIYVRYQNSCVFF